MTTDDPFISNDMLVCDRCGDIWRVAEVRLDLPCCPVPLCDECANAHRISIRTLEGTESSGPASFQL